MSTDWGDRLATSSGMHHSPTNSSTRSLISSTTKSSAQHPYHPLRQGFRPAATTPKLLQERKGSELATGTLEMCRTCQRRYVSDITRGICIRCSINEEFRRELALFPSAPSVEAPLVTPKATAKPVRRPQTRKSIPSAKPENRDALSERPKKRKRRSRRRKPLVESDDDEECKQPQENIPEDVCRSKVPRTTRQQTRKVGVPSPVTTLCGLNKKRAGKNVQKCNFRRHKHQLPSFSEHQSRNSTDKPVHNNQSSSSELIQNGEGRIYSDTLRGIGSIPSSPCSLEGASQSTPSLPCPLKSANRHSPAHPISSERGNQKFTSSPLSSEQDCSLIRSGSSELCPLVVADTFQISSFEWEKFGSDGTVEKLCSATTTTAGETSDDDCILLGTLPGETHDTIILDDSLSENDSPKVPEATNANQQIFYKESLPSTEVNGITLLEVSLDNERGEADESDAAQPCEVSILKEATSRVEIRHSMEEMKLAEVPNLPTAGVEAVEVVGEIMKDLFFRYLGHLESFFTTLGNLTPERKSAMVDALKDLFFRYLGHLESFFSTLGSLTPGRKSAMVDALIPSEQFSLLRIFKLLRTISGLLFSSHDCPRVDRLEVELSALVDDVLTRLSLEVLTSTVTASEYLLDGIPYETGTVSVPVVACREAQQP